MIPRNLYRASLNLNRVCSINNIIHGSNFQKRTLFTNEVLGIDRFLDYRNRVQQQFGKHKALFSDRFSSLVNDDEAVILSEDLKNLIFLATDEKDLELLQKSIDKFSKQNESLSFGTFQFGPVVMRLAHHMNQPQVALTLMEEKNVGFYSQLSSVTIALDLLFKNDKHQEVLNLFDYVLEHYKFDVKYPADFVTLLIAASYRLNTPEAFEQSLRVLREVKLSKDSVKLRALYLFFALAIKQNRPTIALELIQEMSFRFQGKTLHSLRIMALAGLGRHNDILEIFKFNLKKDAPTRKDKLFFEDSLQFVEQKFQDSGKKDILENFQKLKKNLVECNLIESAETLEKTLLEPIHFVRTLRQQNKPQQSPSHQMQQQRV